MVSIDTALCPNTDCKPVGEIVPPVFPDADNVPVVPGQLTNIKPMVVDVFVGGSSVLGNSVYSSVCF